MLPIIVCDPKIFLPFRLYMLGGMETSYPCYLLYGWFQTVTARTICIKLSVEYQWQMVTKITVKDLQIKLAFIVRQALERAKYCSPGQRPG